MINIVILIFLIALRKSIRKKLFIGENRNKNYKTVGAQTKGKLFNNKSKAKLSKNKRCHKRQQQEAGTNENKGQELQVHVGQNEHSQIININYKMIN